MTQVQGNCPMGCGRTLFVGEGGHITCSLLGCPRPTAVDELLADGESEHIVVLREDGFTVMHPIHERLDDAVLNCQLYAELAAMDAPPVALGRYRVVEKSPTEYVYHPLDQPTTKEIEQ